MTSTNHNTNGKTPSRRQASYGSSSHGDDNDDEKTSFLPVQVDNDVDSPCFHKSTKKMKRKYCRTMILGCCVGVSVTLLISNVWRSYFNRTHLPSHPLPPRLDVAQSDTHGNTSDRTDRVSSSQQSFSVVRTRPVCTYYLYGDDDGSSNNNSSTKTPPKIIQTSMEEPSQAWSTIQCYPAQYDDAILNSFGAPDAFLNVNFDATAGTTPIVGFGGAFTEAASLNFQTLSHTGQETVLELLFGATGLGYNIGRFHINSCDFSIQSYSFDEVVDDFELQQFDTNVTHDAQTMIAFAKQAKQLYDASWGSSATNNMATDDESKNRINDDNNYVEKNDDISDNHEIFRFFASPWSPPSWMKSPTWEDVPGAIYASKMTYSGQPSCLRDNVGPDSLYARAWALYFSKFLSAYKDHGIDMWAVTVQNEPEFPAPWEACSYSSQNESNFVAYHLGPILSKDHPDVIIFGFDHNKDHVNTWVDTLLNTTKAEEEDYQSAARYIGGTAYHWYAGGMDRLLDGAVGNANLHRLQSNLAALGVPRNQHIVLGSEACHCPTTGYAGGDVTNYWSRAERYAHTILADLAAGSNGWVEWNLILDGIGGPNHLNNLCDATILAVPHRALNTTVTKPLPSFEHTKPMSADGKSITGDDRTREELNAYGFSAKYLDDGIAVQPLYYYMGHISRYVRPGSYSVMGLVNQNIGGMDGRRIFKPINSVVAGGGMNDLARNGIEITVWPCEGSTRQHFVWDNDIKSKDISTYKRIQVLGHDWLGNPTKSCFARQNSIDLFGMTLTDCSNKLAGMYDIVQVENDDYGRYYIKLLNPVATRRSLLNRGDIHHPSKSQPQQCLYILELGNNGGSYGPRGGAQVALGNCSHESAKWILDIENGTASSIYFAPTDEATANSSSTNTSLSVYDYEVCMTTGWPFLQMGAFLKNSTTAQASDKTVVILNEARESANYVLKDDSENTILLSGSIPPRSIQTILLN